MTIWAMRVGQCDLTAPYLSALISDMDGPLLAILGAQGRGGNVD